MKHPTLDVKSNSALSDGALICLNSMPSSLVFGRI